MDNIQLPCRHCGALNRFAAARLAEQPRCGKCQQPLRDGQVYQPDNEQLQRLITRSSLPVVVDLYADWCGPCQMMAPAFAQLAQQRLDWILVKVNVDKHPQIAQRYASRSVPTLLLFANGQLLAQQAGAMQLTQLSLWVSQGLNR